ncbi:hypothetical protein ACH4NT_04895 [Streptomyces lydicus]|uniref:hypothetical protein n=1 Tax=Streptomyces lydicus TaxID=47763 RepID=UPI0037A59426
MNVLITGSLHRGSVGIVPLSSGEPNLKGGAGHFLGEDSNVLRAFELDDRERGPQGVDPLRCLSSQHDGACIDACRIDGAA